MRTKTGPAFQSASRRVTELKGRVVLITGAGKGAGRLLARAFAERGASVAANDISPVNVEQVVDQINALGGRAKAYIEDVAKKFGAQYIINQVEEDLGQIEILVNHAAVEPHGPLLEIDEWDWHRVLDVNLTGTFLMTQSVGRLMRARGEGVIVNLFTATQISASREAKSGAAFAATMSGLEGFTRQAAVELSPYGIHVHAVETGDEIVSRVMALLVSKRDKS
jgi:3-oxoacyl-[acyl-carrier protein] reductase